MFASDFFERLSHVRPWVPHVIFTPVIAATLWYGIREFGVMSASGLVLFGLFVWTITEYTIHRFLFHPPQWIEDDTRRIISALEPGQAVMPEMPTLRHKFYFLVHGVHHDFPSDSTRLVMPPAVSIPLSTLFLLCFVAIVGAPGVSMFTGFIVGYLAYDTIHFLNHHATIRSRLGRYFKKRHFRHHYLDSSSDFGVSSPLWDAILGTRGKDARR